MTRDNDVTDTGGRPNTPPRKIPEPYATTEGLKDRVRACRTLAQLDEVTASITDAAKAHESKDKPGIAQLRNLILHQRMCIERGWIESCHGKSQDSFSG